MKISIQIQVFPTDEQILDLKATMSAFNQACTWLARQGFVFKIFSKYGLQKQFYRQLREDFSLSSQMTVRVCARVAASFSREKTVCPSFRAFAGVPYDCRILSFQRDSEGVPISLSLLTLAGRRTLPVKMGQRQRDDFSRALKTGEAVLLQRKNGKWFFQVSVEVPEKPLVISETFLGVDLGIVNLAANSDGELHSGNETEACRKKNAALRASLQRKKETQRQAGIRPKSVCRKLKKLSGRESRFKKNTNHCISKDLVLKAKGTERGIALEDLSGIRKRVGKRLNRENRARFGTWAFWQLRFFIEYKALQCGVEVRLVDPQDSSITCFVCRHVDKKNRHSQSAFVCTKCGHTEHADINASQNHSLRASVNTPKVSRNTGRSAV